MEWIRSFTTNKRLNVYDTAAIKQELDRAIESVVLTDKDFCKVNFYTNVKILLGFASLGIAGLVYLFSCPAKSCQGNTLISVIFFFVLSILGPWFTQTLEKKAIIVGTIYSQNSCTIRVETKLARYDNSFETVIEVINGIERKRFKWTTPYNQYFTNKGTFLQHNFQVSFQKFYEESKANASS